MPDILSTPITGQSIVAPSESGGASVQSDWNENNPQSKAYIQNKPFYEELGEKVLVYGPTSIDKAGTIPEGIYYIMLQTELSGDLTFNDNDHLVLMVDDTEFEFALEGSSSLYRNFTSELDAMSLVSKGSVAYMLGKEGGSWIFMAVIPVTSQKTYTVSVYKIESNTRKLPARFVDLKVPQNIMDGSALGSVRCIMAAQENDEYTIGAFAFAEGAKTIASGMMSHAEGQGTTASSTMSHAEGDRTTASGADSHAEGYMTTASGTSSHAEGSATTSSGLTSHAEGLHTIANHASQHVFGQYNVADSSTARSDTRGTYVEIVGNGTAKTSSNARTLDWNGNEVLAGKLTVGAAPTADMDVATKKYVDDNADKFPEITAADDGKVMVAVNGEWVNEDLLTIGTEHVILPETEGVSLNNKYNIDLTAFPSVPVYDLQYIAVHNGRRYELGTNMFDLGAIAVYPPDFDLTSSDQSSDPEIMIMIDQGDGIAGCTATILPEDTNHTLTLIAKIKTIVKNEYIPFAIKAGSGAQSIAEGSITNASGNVSHAEGFMTTASGSMSHAEGAGTTASGNTSHAEGNSTRASGVVSHAEGQTTTASGAVSHAEGAGTTASGERSHVEGLQTIANHASQHVFGEYNVADPSTTNADSRGTYIEIVGNGTRSGRTESRSNARTLDWDGNEVLAGKLTVGAAPTADMDVATKKYVDDNIGWLPEITPADDGKVMVAQNGEWTNVGLLNLGKEYVIFPEATVVPDVSGETSYQINVNSLFADGHHLATPSYTATYNGIDYKLGSAYGDFGSGDMLVLFSPEDFDILNSSEEPEIELSIMNNKDPEQPEAPDNWVLSVDALPEATNHRLALKAEVFSTVVNECIPFAIKAGSGLHAISEGVDTTASGDGSHAEGYGGTYTTLNGTTYESGAKGQADHVEGYQTLTASDGIPGNHAEGFQTQATGGASHAEGGSTIASGMTSHAEGSSTTASGIASHAEGRGTTANHASQHVFGEFNVADQSTAAATDRGTYIEIVGNGTRSGTIESHSNARTLDWNGNEVLAGGLTVGAAGITIGNTTITESQLTYLLSLVPQEP